MVLQDELVERVHSRLQQRLIETIKELTDKGFMILKVYDTYGYPLIVALHILSGSTYSNPTNLYLYRDGQKVVDLMYTTFAQNSLNNDRSHERINIVDFICTESHPDYGTIVMENFISSVKKIYPHVRKITGSYFSADYERCPDIEIYSKDYYLKHGFQINDDNSLSLDL